LQSPSGGHVYDFHIERSIMVQATSDRQRLIRRVSR